MHALLLHIEQLLKRLRDRFARPVRHQFVYFPPISSYQPYDQDAVLWFDDLLPPS